jgi:molybdopterin molybdotransferase
MTALSVGEAVSRVMAAAAPVDAESVPLRESLGRVLADDVRARAPLPRWDNSSMDGYAVRAGDIAGATPERPRVLAVAGTARAGGGDAFEVAAGHAVRIMTGARLPRGAECVVRIEDTDAGRESVVVFSDRDAGHNVRPAGEDLGAGEVALAAGTGIGTAQLALLAAIGCRVVPVRRRPRVAVLCSGDELVTIDELDGEPVPDDRIVSANSYSIEALATATGASVLQLGVVGDDPDLIRPMVEQCVACDLLITSGGVSMGEHDYTRRVMESLRVSDSFWRVKMRPGGPLAFGMLGDLPWLALPGNPVSTMVTFELFARPMIRRMAGHSRAFRVPERVELADAVTTPAPLTHFLRAIVKTHADGRRTARLTGSQGSGLLTSMVRANALLVIDESRPRVEAGELVPSIMLHDESQHSAEFSL